MGLDNTFGLRSGLYVAVLLILAGSSNSISGGIKCWVCNSEHDPRCLDPFDNSTFVITDCDQLDYLQNEEHRGHNHAATPPVKSTMCRKTSSKVNGVWHVVRGCGGPATTLNGTSYCIGPDERDCYCSLKDGCNESWKNHPGVYVLVGSLLLGFLTLNLNH